MKKGFICILVYAIAQTLLLIASKQGLVDNWVAITPLLIVTGGFALCLVIGVIKYIKGEK